MTHSIRKETHYGGRIFDCYAERPASVEAMLADAVRADPTAIALEDGEREFSYRDLDRAAARLAGSFSSIGVARGDRVAMVLDNRAEFVLVILACAKLGAVAVPMGIRLRRPEIEFICANSDARLLIHEAALAQHLPEPAALPGLTHRFAVGGEAVGSLPFGPLLSGEEIEAAGIAEEDALCIMYTSGTTGEPKGALITHLGLIHSALHWVDRLCLPRGISTALAIPISHIAGFAGVIMPLLHLGGRTILVRDFKAASLLGLMSKKRVEHALLVPAMYNLCLLNPGLRDIDLSAWRWGVYGGAPMPEATIRRFSEILPLLQMCNAYGATETTSPATIMKPGHGVDHSESIGHAVTCGDIRIMDDEGREVPAGRPGELYIAGPMVVPGYWRNEEANAKSFVSGYWKSGDIGSVDAEGFVRIFDRKKDMIIRGGYKVYPAEVENALAEHPDVIEAAVIGRTDDVLGEKVAAFIHGKAANLTAEVIRAFCRERMADYKVPDIVELRDEPLPRNANGKLQKDILRKS